jgi:PBSX family phage terminase large subunit
MSEIIAPFKPHSWQVEPWKYTGPVMLLTGSAGGGKSRLAGEKVHGYLKKYPGAMGLMLRKMRQSMTNSTVLFMDRLVIGDDPQVRHYPSKLRFEYSNGSVLAYGGMSNEEQREQIRSIGTEGGVDIVWMEEASRFVENDFNEVLARMRGKAAPWMQVILSTNPDIPTHWIYKRLIQQGEAKVFYSSALDNPANPEAYLANLERLTGVLYKRLVKGQWIQAEGAVYDGYDTSIHLIDPFPIPPEWRRIRVVDFGYTNPFVCHWWAMDNDGRMYRYREIYKTQTLVEDHARQIVALSNGERIEATICDHDAEDRATLERHGVPTVAASKAISVGIQAVQARLRKAGDGRPRLYLMRDALVETDRALETEHKPLCTEDEFPAYIYPEGKDGRPVKEEPVKLNDHGMDALRYAVMYLDGSGPSAGETVDVPAADYRRERRSVMWNR